MRVLDSKAGLEDLGLAAFRICKSPLVRQVGCAVRLEAGLQQLHGPGEQLGQAGGVGFVLGLPRLGRRVQAHRADAPPGRVQP